MELIFSNAGLSGEKTELLLCSFTKGEVLYNCIPAVRYFLDNNVSQLDTCKIFNCNPRSLMRWVNKYKTTNTIKRKNRTYKSYKVNKQQVDYLSLIHI